MFIAFFAFGGLALAGRRVFPFALSRQRVIGHDALDGRDADAGCGRGRVIRRAELDFESAGHRGGGRPQAAAPAIAEVGERGHFRLRQRRFAHAQGYAPAFRVRRAHNDGHGLAGPSHSRPQVLEDGRLVFGIHRDLDGHRTSLGGRATYRGRYADMKHLVCRVRAGRPGEDALARFGGLEVPVAARGEVQWRNRHVNRLALRVHCGYRNAELGAHVRFLRLDRHYHGRLVKARDGDRRRLLIRQREHGVIVSGREHDGIDACVTEIRRPREGGPVRVRRENGVAARGKIAREGIGDVPVVRCVQLQCEQRAFIYRDGRNFVQDRRDIKRRPGGHERGPDLGLVRRALHGVVRREQRQESCVRRALAQGANGRALRERRAGSVPDHDLVIPLEVAAAEPQHLYQPRFGRQRRGDFFLIPESLFTKSGRSGSADQVRD